MVPPSSAASKIRAPDCSDGVLLIALPSSCIEGYDVSLDDAIALMEDEQPVDADSART